ncbi:MAG: hypothetical protein FWF35_04850, partial [Elusimicrobia bacterium]|nr:hypothetical protein [Elusimicrobiota bacterium]
TPSDLTQPGMVWKTIKYFSALGDKTSQPMEATFLAINDGGTTGVSPCTPACTGGQYCNDAVTPPTCQCGSAYDGWDTVQLQCVNCAAQGLVWNSLTQSCIGQCDNGVKPSGNVAGTPRLINGICQCAAGENTVNNGANCCVTARTVYSQEHCCTDASPFWIADGCRVCGGAAFPAKPTAAAQLQARQGSVADAAAGTCGCDANGVQVAFGICCYAGNPAWTPASAGGAATFGSCCPAATPIWNGTACQICPTGQTPALNASDPSQCCPAKNMYWVGTSCITCTNWNGTACITCAAPLVADGSGNCLCNNPAANDATQCCPSKNMNWNGTTCVACPAPLLPDGLGGCICKTPALNDSTQCCTSKNMYWNGGICVACPVGGSAIWSTGPTDYNVGGPTVWNETSKYCDCAPGEKRSARTGSGGDLACCTANTPYYIMPTSICCPTSGFANGACL